jgi:CHAD domain-containing protein
MNRRTSSVAGRLLARRAADLTRHVSGALEGDAHGVHQARVASRRLREAVPVLSAGVKGTKARKARGKIRRLTQALGTVRELDVTIQLLDELVANETLPRPALEAVRGRVVSERDARRAVMLKRFEHVNMAKLERRLTSTGEVLDAARSEPWRDALGARLLKRSKALATAMTAAGRMYSPEQLHQVRIAAKKLRYAMELAFDAGVKSASAPVRAVKRAQDTLGRLHDLQVLQSHVAAVQAQPSGRSLPDGGLDIISRQLENECRHLHAQYVATMPRLAEVVEATRSVVVPALAHRARAMKMTKMTLPARPARQPQEQAQAKVVRRAPARRVGPAAGEQR